MVPGTLQFGNILQDWLQQQIHDGNNVIFMIGLATFLDAVGGVVSQALLNIPTLPLAR